MNILPTHRKRSCLSRLLLTMVGAALATLSSASPSAAKGEQTTVTCYKGNPADGKVVGTINATFLKENAITSCISTYYDDCKGECVACYTDPDSGKTVCYDSEGTKSVK